jgi:hypothetical protein
MQESQKYSNKISDQLEDILVKCQELKPLIFEYITDFSIKESMSDYNKGHIKGYLWALDSLLIHVISRIKTERERVE